MNKHKNQAFWKARRKLPYLYLFSSWPYFLVLSHCNPFFSAGSLTPETCVRSPYRFTCHRLNLQYLKPSSPHPFSGHLHITFFPLSYLLSELDMRLLKWMQIHWVLILCFYEGNKHHSHLIWNRKKEFITIIVVRSIKLTGKMPVIFCSIINNWCFKLGFP